MSGKGNRNLTTGGGVSPRGRNGAQPSSGSIRRQRENRSLQRTASARQRQRVGPRAPLPRFLNVAVMEDVKGVRNSMIGAFKHHGWGIHRVWTANTALKLAIEQDVRFFVLDIDMGDRGDQLGLEVLQRLMAHDKQICVVILTSHTREFRDRAVRAGASVVAKTAEIEHDIKSVLAYFYRHLERMAQMRGEELGFVGAVALRSDAGLIAADPNEAEFLRLSSTPQWVRENSGMYAAIVDGRCVDVFEDREACVDALVTGYANRSRYMAKVDAPMIEFELPSILDIEFSRGD